MEIGKIFLSIFLDFSFIYPMIFLSLTNINIADSIRDKSNRRDRNGRKGSGESEVSPDELFTVTNRKKHGHLRDSLAAAERPP